MKILSLVLLCLCIMTLVYSQSKSLRKEVFAHQKEDDGFARPNPDELRLNEQMVPLLFKGIPPKRYPPIKDLSTEIVDDEVPLILSFNRTDFANKKKGDGSGILVETVIPEEEVPLILKGIPPRREPPIVELGLNKKKGDGSGILALNKKKGDGSGILALNKKKGDGSGILVEIADEEVPLILTGIPPQRLPPVEIFSEKKKKGDGSGILIDSVKILTGIPGKRDPPTEKLSEKKKKGDGSGILAQSEVVIDWPPIIFPDQ